MSLIYSVLRIRICMNSMFLVVLDSHPFGIRKYGSVSSFFRQETKMQTKSLVLWLVNEFLSLFMIRIRILIHMLSMFLVSRIQIWISLYLRITIPTCMCTKMVQIHNSAFSVLWIQNDQSFYVNADPYPYLGRGRQTNANPCKLLSL